MAYYTPPPTTAVTSADITDNEIVNADINSSAAIDASKIANGTVSSTEFQYLDGVTSAIQTQITARVIATHTVSAAGTLTLSTAGFYVFSGTTTTWTLPDMAASTGLVYHIKNRGSGAITLNRAGADNIYNTSSVTSLTINAGEGYLVSSDGTYWIVH